jgi:outer membrane protein assembly factor BamD (BamD/ComL family)
VFLISFYSCAPYLGYNQAKKANSIEAYNEFLIKHPKCKYTPEINKRKNILEDNKAWEAALNLNTILSYNLYLQLMPNGQYINEAKQKIVLIQSEEIAKAWNYAKKSNSIVIIQNFNKLYPNSIYKYEAEFKILELEEDLFWNDICKLNTIDAYNKYLIKFPHGKYSVLARNKIEYLEEELYVKPIWENTLKKNTYKDFKAFYDKYTSSSFASLAEGYLIKFEQDDWDKACVTNTIKAYKLFLKKYPESDRVTIVEKKIIDLEVDEIFNSDHGQLPPMNQSADNNYKSTNSIKIFNNTKYTLTIRYSGVESRKIELSPYQTQYVYLKIGFYRIAASVNASYVRNYAGTENLKGSEYESEYFIRTIRE